MFELGLVFRCDLVVCGGVVEVSTSGVVAVETVGTMATVLFRV